MNAFDVHNNNFFDPIEKEWRSEFTGYGFNLVPDNDLKDEWWTEKRIIGSYEGESIIQYHSGKKELELLIEVNSDVKIDIGQKIVNHILKSEKWNNVKGNLDNRCKKSSFKNIHTGEILDITESISRDKKIKSYFFRFYQSQEVKEDILKNSVQTINCSHYDDAYVEGEGFYLGDGIYSDEKLW